MSRLNSVDQRSSPAEKKGGVGRELLARQNLLSILSRQWIHLALLVLVSLALFIIPLWLFEFKVAVFWLLAGLICLWFGARLEHIWRPERRVYRQMIEQCSRIAGESSDAEQLLDKLSQSLYQTLALESLTIWRHQAEVSTLTLLRYQGALTIGDLTELPLDLAATQVQDSRPVVNLPESALRQGLLALGMQAAISLRLGEELVGLIGLGRTHFGRGYTTETLHWLDLMAGQLALVVKNACLIGDLEETVKKLQLAYRRSIEVEAEERQRLAVELHDDILSRLTTVMMSLRHSQGQLGPAADQLESQLESIGQEIGYISRRLREITQGLHPSVLSDLGLISALQAYMDSLGKQIRSQPAGVVIALTAQGFGEQRLAEPKLERDIYYITRQALDNALKHAQAEQVFIHLRWLEDALSITVQDTGCGLKAPPEQLIGQNGRLGLLSMYERALAWGGRLTIQTGRGQGTTIHARIPVDQPSNAPTHLQALTHYL
jgi:signal transduction histidine kinase